MFRNCGCALNRDDIQILSFANGIYKIVEKDGIDLTGLLQRPY